MLKKMIFNLISLLLVGLYSFNVMAASCDEKSPTYVEQGDKYTDIEDVARITEKQKESLKKIFSTVKTNLKGTGSTTVCFVDENGKMDKHVEAEKYKAKFSLQDNGVITLSIDAEKLKQGATYNESQTFFNTYSMFVIKKITDNSVEAISKYRISRSAKGTGGKKTTKSILREEIVKLTSHGKGLEIASTTYINGYYSDEYSRKFK